MIEAEGTDRIVVHRAAPDLVLADGLAFATTEREGADLASFDRRVRRALAGIGLRLSPALAG